MADIIVVHRVQRSEPGDALSDLGIVETLPKCVRVVMTSEQKVNSSDEAEHRNHRMILRIGIQLFCKTTSKVGRHMTRIQDISSWCTDDVTRWRQWH